MVVVNPEERFLLIMKYTENRKLITVALPEKTSENGLMIMMQEQNDQELVHNEKGAVRFLFYCHFEKIEVPYGKLLKGAFLCLQRLLWV